MGRYKGKTPSQEEAEFRVIIYQQGKGHCPPRRGGTSQGHSTGVQPLWEGEAGRALTELLPAGRNGKSGALEDLLSQGQLVSCAQLSEEQRGFTRRAIPPLGHGLL